MAEFQVRADAVDVEQIMRQIRARIREKRGADYTEQEIRELASVKLEKFLDPRGVRSNLVEDFRRNRQLSPAPEKLEAQFEPITIRGSHRSALESIRKMLQPIVKLFINPTTIIYDINQAFQKLAAMPTVQNRINEDFHRRFRQREEMDPLYYEVIHNLVVELTRLSIENNNLKMRVESLSSRMDFDERRARALESVVQYKPAPKPTQGDRPQPAPKPQSDGQTAAPAAGGNTGSGNGQPATVDPVRAGIEPRDQGERGERRRRRRRRRRSGQNLANQGAPNADQNAAQGATSAGAETGGDYDGPDDDGSGDDGPEETPGQGGGAAE